MRSWTPSSGPWRTNDRKSRVDLVVDPSAGTWRIERGLDRLPARGRALFDDHGLLRGPRPLHPAEAAGRPAALTDAEREPIAFRDSGTRHLAINLSVAWTKPCITERVALGCHCFGG